MQKENYKFSDEEWAMFQQGVEIWRDIEGCENYYQISTFGRVKSLKRKVPHPTSKFLTIKERILRLHIWGRGYYYAAFHGANGSKIESIHALVGYAFLNNPLNRNEFNHKDGVKLNNYLYNLEFCTRSENLLHCYREKLRVAPTSMLGKFGKDHHSSKPILQYDKNGNFINRFNGGAEASRMTGVNKGNLAACALGMVKLAAGYIWRYEEDL
jgi:hypothetical protein